MDVRRGFPISTVVDRLGDQAVVVAGRDDDVPTEAHQLSDRELNDLVSHPVAVKEIARDEQPVSASFKGEIHDVREPAAAAVAELIEVQVRRMDEQKVRLCRPAHGYEGPSAAGLRERGLGAGFAAAASAAVFARAFGVLAGAAPARAARPADAFSDVR